MKRLNILTAMLFFGFVCAVVAWSDIINLKSGGRLEGIIQEETDDAITLLLPGGGRVIIRRDMVKSVEKTSPEEQVGKSHKPKKEKGRSEYRSEVQEQDKKPKAQKPERPVPEPTGFPDGLVGRRYSLVIAPKDAVPPYKITLLSGNLPPGLIINERIGGIEGEPNQPGEWELELSLVDSKGKKETIKDTIHIWKRLLTVGEDGTLKGFNGMQMALNMAQDFDEIRIQAGTCKGTGLVTPENKEWENGIKISGGWDEDFLNRKGKTILDGGKRENSILTISNEKGEIHIEDLTFTNSKGGAVETELYKGNKEKVFFTRCSFIRNSAPYRGGAIRGVATFTNCTFTNNKAEQGGACCSSGSNFINCAFSENYAEKEGGATCSFIDEDTFIDCIFTNNSAGVGGAVNMGAGRGTFINCIFNKNSSKGLFLVEGNGGAVYFCSGGTFINCIFDENFAKNKGGGIGIGSNSVIVNCFFHKNSASSGGAISNPKRVVACTFYNNKAKKEGGAVFCEGGNKRDIFNSIFYKNIAREENNDVESRGNLGIDYCLINHLKGVANFGPHNIIGDPKFVDLENGKFSLRADSPCIDKGTTLEEIKKEVEEIIKEIEDEKIRKMAEKSLSSDLAGNPRIAGGKVDLGAYERQGSKTIRIGFVKAKREKGEAEKKGSILGKWKGEVLTPGFGAYPVEVTINRISENLEAGTTKYPSLNCGETLWYLGFKDNTFTFRQQLNYNYDGKCAGGGTIKLKILSNNSLHWQSYWPSGREGSSGILRRE